MPGHALKILLFISCCCILNSVAAQSADSVYSQYLDFNLARFQGETEKVLGLGEQLIPLANKLPPKARINFYAAAGKMYEDNNQPQKAIPFYEMVAAAVPDYYVVHRALGYIYLEGAKSAEKKLLDNPGSLQLKSYYATAVQKALPHLEKAQACDPSDETLAIIKKLYSSTGNQKGLLNLDERLKALAVHCIDILPDN